MIMVVRIFDILLYCLLVEIDYIGRYSSIKGMHDYTHMMFNLSKGIVNVCLVLFYFI